MKHPDPQIIDDVFVSIIILNYNGGQLILECVESIKKTIGCKFEIILIDNYSSDNSHVLCKQKFPEIILIQNDKNMGMSARNIGIKNAKGNFIVFLDSDTEVEPNWLLTFINSYKQHGEGLYQPKFLKKGQTGIIDSAGNMINIFGLAYARGKGEQDKGQYDQFQTISYTAGACIFSSIEIIKKIGDVDDIFFAYHDDVDYGWRASLLGIKSYYEPKVVVSHFSSTTFQWSPKKFFLLERNRWICLLTLYNQKTVRKIFPLLVLIEIGMLFFFLRHKMGFTKIKSCISLIKMRKEIKIRRERITKNRKFEDKIVIQSFVDDFWLPTYRIDRRKSQFVNSWFVALNKQARKLIS
jgi:GT2 family glycosyltransferase